MRFILTLECYFLIGDNKMIDKTKITNFANSIKNFVTQEITNHANITANNSTKGHVQAGGIPQNISTTASAGTDNGYYARADHIHKASFNNLADKPATFTPSAHNHTISNITNLQTSLSDKSDKDHTHSQQDVSFVGSTEIWQGLGSNKNIGQAIEYVMNLLITIIISTKYTLSEAFICQLTTQIHQLFLAAHGCKLRTHFFWLAVTLMQVMEMLQPPNMVVLMQL